MGSCQHKIAQNTMREEETIPNQKAAPRRAAETLDYRFLFFEEMSMVMRPTRHRTQNRPLCYVPCAIPIHIGL